MNTRHIILLLGVALFASIVGALAWRLLMVDHVRQSTNLAQAVESAAAEQALAQTVAPLEGTRRPDYTLGGSNGEQVTAADFDGRVVLVNFWATWCAPCRKEMPMLVELHHEYRAKGLEVVGIALDEVDQARKFAADLGVDYPILVGTTDVMATAREYGNLSGVLPYTVLIDREGIIRWTHLGEVKKAEVTREIAAVLD